MPTHPFFEGLTPPLHIAHRGGALLAPENTLVAFERAVRTWRTDMLELDVQLTRDGELVVFHDDTVDRCTNGSGDISELRWEELRQLDAGYRFTTDGGQTFPFRGQGVRVPLLSEVLNAFPSARVNIEVKRGPKDIEEVLRRVLERTGAMMRVCCGSTEDELAGRVHQALPEACHFYPREALTSFVLSVRMGDEPPEDPRYTVLDMPAEFGGERLINEELLDAVRRHDKWVNVWTIDDEAEMEELITLGVGGVMTDRPDVLRRVLDSRTSPAR